MRSILLRAAAALGPLVFLFACGGGQTDAKTSDSNASSNAPSATPSAAAPPSAAPAASAPTEEAPSAASKRPLDVTSECADVVHVVYGDDPKGPARASIAQGGTTEAPRRADGTQIVLLLDDHDESIAKVTITRHMKHVVIGRSCRTLDAR